MELRGEAVLGRAAAASSVARFCKGIVDAVGPYVVAVKPQSAFFEALGSDGFRALEEVCDYARAAGLLVLVDAKRGDIGSTSRAYAAGVSRAARRRRPARRRDDGQPVPRAATRSSRSSPPVAGTARACSSSSARRTRAPPTSRTSRCPTAGRCGITSRSSCTSGASRSSARGHVERRRGRRCDASRARSRRRGGCFRSSPMLLPGVGAQGATPADVARAFTAGPASALVTASRSVIFAYRDSEADWRTRRAPRPRTSRLRCGLRPGGESRAGSRCDRGRECDHAQGSCGPAKRSRASGLVARQYIVAPLMRRALLAVVALVAALAILALASSAGAQTSEPAIPAASWYLVGDDGAVLARHDADRSRAIASITKLMTAIVVLEHAKLDDVVPRQPRGREDRRVDGLPPRRRGAHRRASSCARRSSRARTTPPRRSPFTSGGDLPIGSWS